MPSLYHILLLHTLLIAAPTLSTLNPLDPLDPLFNPLFNPLLPRSSLPLKR
jgi:hypothetical protein